LRSRQIDGLSGCCRQAAPPPAACAQLPALPQVGNPAGEPVMQLHGTTGNGSNFLSAAFADQMFGPGQPLDAARYVIILPDSIGTGDSSKRPDGLRAKISALQR
jgi:pimeloyl-ACP methyl ester carboxylesterase